MTLTFIKKKKNKNINTIHGTRSPLQKLDNSECMKTTRKTQTLQHSNHKTLHEMKMIAPSPTYKVYKWTRKRLCDQPNTLTWWDQGIAGTAGHSGI